MQNSHSEIQSRKEPWEAFPQVWPTKSKFFSWLRGGFRKAVWSKYPGRIIFKNEHCSPPPEGYLGRAKSGAYCSLTGEWVNKSALEVDHIVGEASLRDWEDVESFIRHLCTTPDNMQLVSKEAHRVKSHAERYGLSFEEAILAKKVIAFGKLSAQEQIKELTNLIDSETIIPKTKAGRVELFKQTLEKG